MMDADDVLLGELEKKGGRLFVRFDFHPVLNKLKTFGGRIPLAGKTKAEVESLLEYGAKEVEMHDGTKMLDVPAAGRPIHDNVEYVEVVVPGDKTQCIHRPVTDKDRRAYAQQYAAWRAGSDQDAASGTLLEEWPGITKAQVEDLKHFRVRTVEQLAELSDGNASKLGPILSLRQRARDFLEKAKGNAPMEKMRAELSAKANEIDALKKQVAELVALSKRAEASAGKAK